MLNAVTYIYNLMLCIIVKYQVKVNHKYSDSNRNGSSETLEST